MLKRLTGSSILFFLAVASFAQNKALQFSTGAGLTNTLINPIAPNSKAIASYHVCLSIAFDLNGVLLTTGILFQSTGYSISGEFIITDQRNQQLLISGVHHSRFTHIGIPLLVGNRYRMARKVFLVSSVGLIPTYNVNNKSTFENNYFRDENILTDEAFNKIYKRFSLFGVVQSRLEFSATKHFSFFAGSAFRVMTSNIRKPTNVSNRAEREYALLLDTGVSVGLGR